MKKQTVLKGVYAFVSVILSLALMLTVGDVTKSSEAKRLVSTDEISFVNGNKAVYRVVRSDDSDSEVGSVAVSVYKKYKEVFGVVPQNTTDAEDGENVREILVGDTNRPATAKAKQLLASDGSGKDCDYIICSIDDDIVVYGNCPRAVREAGEVFTKLFLKTENEEGIYYMYKGQNNNDNLTFCSISDISRFTVVRPIYNVSYLTQRETDKLRELLYEKTGYEVPLMHDSFALEDTDYSDHYGGDLKTTEATEYEIIIGNCDRDGVSKIQDANRYAIRIEDTKIYLNGGSAYATTMAVSEFIKLVEKHDTIDSSMSVADGNYEQAVSGYDTATYYRPTWKEDFDAAAIHTGRWKIAWDKYETQCPDGKPCYRGSSELKNNYIEDGCLVIEAAKTEDAYYGGMLDTSRSMQFKYGFLEISDIHPKGNSFWTALWMVTGWGDKNAYWTSETDVDECFGAGNWVWCNIWAWPTRRASNELGLSGRSDAVISGTQYTAEDSRGLWMDFHTYGFEWVDCETIRFTVDGYVKTDIQVQQDELKEAYSQFMYLKLSMALGFPAAGIPSQDEWEWENSNKFIVDWVYLYQLDGNELIKRW